MLSSKYLYIYSEADDALCCRQIKCLSAHEMPPCQSVMDEIHYVFIIRYFIPEIHFALLSSRPFNMLLGSPHQILTLCIRWASASWLPLRSHNRISAAKGRLHAMYRRVASLAYAISATYRRAHEEDHQMTMPWWRGVSKVLLAKPRQGIAAIRVADYRLKAIRLMSRWRCHANSRREACFNGPMSYARWLNR